MPQDSSIHILDPIRRTEVTVADSEVLCISASIYIQYDVCACA